MLGSSKAPKTSLAEEKKGKKKASQAMGLLGS